MPRGRARDTSQDIDVIRILALVYDLSGGRVCLTITQLAAWIQRADSAAHLRIAHLLREGFVEHDGVRGYRPTDAGRKLLEAAPPESVTESLH